MNQALLDHFSQGGVIIVWDEYREHEGDFMLLGEYATPKLINLFLTRGKGMVVAACSNKIFDQFDLQLMVKSNDSPHNTQMGIGFDARKNTTTGVSAPDRARSIQLLCDEKATHEHMTFPGHTFPLQAMDLSERFGHTDVAVWMAQQVGKKEVVILCEILDENGDKASKEYLKNLSQELEMPMTSLEEIKNWVSSV